MERMKTQVELLKESCDIKDAACVRYQKRIAELEKENKKLREYTDNLDSENDNQAIEIEELKKGNKKLKEERDLYKARNEELNENCFGLAKENENLKSDLAFERTMLDNVRAEYKSLQDIIKKLNEENETLKEELISRIRQPKNVPYGKGVAELMEEDTLQELRDIGEI